MIKDQEPFFLINEFVEEQKEELQKIVDIIEPSNYQKFKKALFIRNFTNGLFQAYRLEKSKRYKNKQQELENLKRKKQDLLKKLQNIQKNKLIEKQEQAKKQLEIEKVNPLEEDKIVKINFNGHQLNIKEPELNEQEEKILKDLKLNTLKYHLEKEETFTQKLKEIANQNYSEELNKKLKYYTDRDLKKYGKINYLIEEPKIKEIICNGTSQPVLVTYENKKEIPTNIAFNSEEELNEFIEKLADKTNSEISEENPFLSSSLKNLEIQATLGSQFVKAKFIIQKSI